MRVRAVLPVVPLRGFAMARTARPWYWKERAAWYVTDLDEYRASLKELGRAYRETIGSYFPAMAVVHVDGLVEPAAKIEIEAMAIIPE